MQFVKMHYIYMYTYTGICSTIYELAFLHDAFSVSLIKHNKLRKCSQQNENCSHVAVYITGNTL